MLLALKSILRTSFMIKLPQPAHQKQTMLITDYKSQRRWIFGGENVGLFELSWKIDSKLKPLIF